MVRPKWKISDSLGTMCPCRLVVRATMCPLCRGPTMSVLFAGQSMITASAVGRLLTLLCLQCTYSVHRTQPARPCRGACLITAFHHSGRSLPSTTSTRSKKQGKAGQPSLDDAPPTSHRRHQDASRREQRRCLLLNDGVVRYETRSGLIISRDPTLRMIDRAWSVCLLPEPQYNPLRYPPERLVITAELYHIIISYRVHRM